MFLSLFEGNKQSIFWFYNASQMRFEAERSHSVIQKQQGLAEICKQS